MKRTLHRSMDLFPALLVAILAIGLLVRCDDEGGSTGESDAADVIDEVDDGDGDVETDGTDDDIIEIDADEDLLADVAPDAPGPVCFADRGERPVGDRCAADNDRICITDRHCRDTELCVWETEDVEYGTCIYQIPDPIDCPGGPSCPTSGAAPLMAAFATRTITPVGWEEPRSDFIDGRHFVGDPEDDETFFDCGRDMICPGDDGYTAPDADGSEGDGVMQGIWMAGLNESVPALRCPPELVGESCTAGVDCCAHELAHDDIWARGVIFQQGESKVALVAVDLIGFFYSDIQDTFAELPEALGIDMLMVASTHAHEGPDTMGLWGPGFGGSSLPVESGIDLDHVAFIRSQIVDLLTEANNNLVAVDVYATQPHTGVELVAANDSRDPWIFNDHMPIMHVVQAGEDHTDLSKTVGLIINWGNHPEAIGSNNHHISSDYPHYVRSYIEDGLPEVMNGGDTVPAMTGTGAPVVFFSGTLGGLTTPLHTSATARDGTVVSSNGFAKADAIGQQLAQLTLATLPTAAQMTADLSFGMREQVVGVPNLRFHIAIFSLELFPEREIYNWRFSDGFEADDPPNLLTAVGRVQIGGASFATVPGEMFPETVVGGFLADDSGADPVRGNPNDVACMDDLLPPEEGDNAGDAIHPCLVDPDNPNPPDLAQAPNSGFIQDEIPGDVLFLIGNGLDSIGYLVPDYDFILHPEAPFVVEAEGDHYEETNGVGPILTTVLTEMEALWGLEDLFIKE